MKTTIRRLLILLPLLLCGFQCPKCYKQPVQRELPDAYEVEFRGIEDKTLLAELKAASRLISEIKKPPQSFPALQYRARSDSERLLKVMHSYSYYGAKVNVRFEREGEKPKVILIFYQGPAYPLVSFELVGVENITLQQLCIELGKPAIAENILDAARRVREILMNSGYPLVKVMDEEVTVDQTEQTVAVKLPVESGPCCQFGLVKINGLCTLRRRFVTQCMMWRRGERYDPQKVECMVDYLRRSGQFQNITIMHEPEAEENGELDMQIDVKEAKHKTIALGVSYNLDQGLGPEGQWENRNLWGMGETLGVAATSGYRRKEAKVYFIRPHFLRCDQNLFLSVEGARDSIIAYKQYSASFSAHIERIVNRRLSYSYGGRVEWLDIDDTDNDGAFWLFGAPIKVEYKRVDDPLNPARGFRIDYDLIPTVYRGGKPRQREVRFYNKQIARFYGYVPLTRNKRYILAGKLMIGSILGPKNFDIPTSHRFLMGSVSTLRGYRYETVGPLSPNGTPIGGRSLLLYGIEGRVQTSETLGFTVFYELGNVYKQRFPPFNQKLLQSVGVGARYFTPLGPIGVDVAVPLNRRDIDHAFEVYVSIGQTF